MMLLQGRDFTDEDEGELARHADVRNVVARPGVVIVNETATRTFWPSGQALGQFLSTSYDPKIPRRQVVGILRDARSDQVRTPPPPEVYVPYLEDPSFAMTVVVRTPLPPDAIVPLLRRAMREVDPELSAANVREREEVVSGSIGPTTFSTRVVSAFAAVALLLSAVGIYDVVAFGVSVRRREIGIRMALGATGRDIARLVLGQASGAIGVGVSSG